MISGRERQIFLRERIWSDSDVLLQSKAENGRFEVLVREVMSNLDLDEVDKDSLFVNSYDLMSEEGIEERDIALFLTLLDKALGILEAIEDRRGQIMATLRDTLNVEQAVTDPAERDEQYISELANGIKVLEGNSPSRMISLVRQYSTEALESTEKSVSRFAGPLIRLLLDHHRGNRKYTQGFKQQFSDLLNISPQAVASMKAWRTGDLKNKSVTVQDLISKSRRKAIKAKAKANENPVVNEGGAESKSTIEDHKRGLYDLISDPKCLIVAKAIEPDTFELADGRVSRDQRRWIYSLFLLGAKTDSDKEGLRKYLAEKVFHCSTPKIGAVTAYLAGKLRQKAERAKTPIWQDIQFVQGHAESIDSV